MQRKGTRKVKGDRIRNQRGNNKRIRKKRERERRETAGHGAVRLVNLRLKHLSVASLSKTTRPSLTPGPLPDRSIQKGELRQVRTCRLHAV